MQRTAGDSGKTEQQGIPVDELRSYLQDWNLEAQLRQHTPQSIKSRRSRIGRFFRFLDEQGITEVGPLELRRFFIQLPFLGAFSVKGLHVTDYWITTHWPYMEPDDSPARHVFFKTGTRRHLPEPGDVVFIYESACAVVDGKRVFQTYRCQYGRREIESIPEGRCAIICKARVVGLPREIQPQDVVREYGNLNLWSVIPCAYQVKVRELPKADLMEVLGYPRNTAPRFLSLWRIPDAVVAQRLFERLEGH